MVFLVFLMYCVSRCVSFWDLFVIWFLMLFLKFVINFVYFKGLLLNLVNFIFGKDGFCLIVCVIVSYVLDCFENCGEVCDWDNRDGFCDDEGVVYCVVIVGENLVVVVFRFVVCGIWNWVNSLGVDWVIIGDKLV